MRFLGVPHRHVRTALILSLLGALSACSDPVAPDTGWEPPRDASPVAPKDATAPDAGASDAGSSDAGGIDAAAADAFAGDAVPADAVPSDALPADAIPSDAVPSDAVIPDALSADALSADALSGDALPGVPGDAEPPDAEPTDTGTADTGTSDAGSLDLGQPDASGLDAVTADAQTPDALPADALPPPLPTFVEVYANTATGEPVTGTPEALQLAIDHRADMKVLYESWVLDCGEIAPYGPGHLCETWFPFPLEDLGGDWTIPSSPDWWIGIFNTSGFADHARYRIESHSATLNQPETTPVRWLARDWRIERYAHTSTGGVVRGDLGALLSDVRGGALVTPFAAGPPTALLSTRGGTGLAALFPWHVSIGRTANNDGDIQNDAYHYFQWQNTTGDFQATRWRIGQHSPVGVSTLGAAASWWVEPGWEIVYAHTSTGAALSGSLAALVAAAQEGADVMAEAGDGAWFPCATIIFSADGSALGCLVQNVLGHELDAEGDVVHPASVYRRRIAIQTSGEIEEERHLVGSNTLVSSTQTRASVRWSVNRRGWSSALVTGTGGSTIAGSRAALVAGAAAGADVRVIESFGTSKVIQRCHAVKLDVPGNRLACAHFVEAPGDGYYYLGVMNTTGVLRDHRICYGTTTNCGVSTQAPDRVDWLVRP